MKMITLKNGLRVAVVEMNHLHSCEVGMYFKVGAMNDPKGKEGLAHFAEHLLFRGTKSYPSEKALSKAFETVGGLANASTDEETTCFHTQFHPTKTDEVFEILSSMILDHLLLDFQIEKSIITQEAKGDYNDRRQLVVEEDVIKMLLWQNHPLSTAVIGSLKSIRGIKLDDVKNHISINFTPDNAVLVVCGKVNTDEIFELTEKYFSRWQGKRQISEIPEVVSNQAEPVYKFVHDCTNQFQICVGFRGFSRKDKRMSPARLLGFSMSEDSSDLYSKLRGEQGLVYDVSASTDEFPTTGMFLIKLSTEPSKFIMAMETVFDEIISLAHKPLKEEDFIRFQNSYIFEIDYGRDMTARMNMKFGYGLLFDHLRTIDEDKELVSSMCPEQLREVAKTVFHPRNLNIVVIGPYTRKDKLAVEQAIQIYKEKYDKI